MLYSKARPRFSTVQGAKWKTVTLFPRVVLLANICTLCNCLSARCGRVQTTRVLNKTTCPHASHMSVCQVKTSRGNATTSLDLTSKQTGVSPSPCATWRTVGAKWKTGPCVCQVYCSHDMAIINKWRSSSDVPVLQIRPTALAVLKGYRGGAS
jgi:hypothetical protein